AARPRGVLRERPVNVRAALAALLLVASACGLPSATELDLGVDLAVEEPDLGGPTCPNDLPASCPQPAPSWQGTVSQLIAQKCVICHAPTGIVAEKPLDTYDAVFRMRGPVLNQVYSCNMPPPDGGALDDEERQALLGWLVCGAPKN